MAMLAEPRRKQKIINLRAKNNAWSNDNSKFGQRMLEKMGWSSGKGLGANENGITEHVVARYKNDDKGLGFEDKNDQWTKHEDDFNALLANLSNASDINESLHSGISLEDKSKKSKARIHYHKFTRGKDISRYSEKDLANIFGKKTFKNTEVVQEPIKEDIKTTEQVFTEKGSMEDYFKSKLAVFKNKSANNISNVKTNSDFDEPDYNFCGFAQETTDDTELCLGLGYSHEDKCNNEKVNTKCNDDGLEKMKKKKKSSKMDICDSIDEGTCLNNKCDNNRIQEGVEGKIKTKKKKKKSKSKNNEGVNEGEISQEYCLTDYKVDSSISKEKKKLKNEVNNISQNIKVISEQDQDPESSKKNKKISKNIDDCNETSLPEEIKKKKKSKRKLEENLEDVTLNNENVNIKKKTRKNEKIS